MFKTKFYKKTFLLLSCTSIIPYAATALASDNYKKPQKYPIITDFVLSPGNERQMGRVNVTVPLFQDREVADKKLLFGDARITASDQDTLEGNFGIGYRQLQNDKNVIVGGYGFYDRLITENNNQYSQFTFGTEIMHQNWDARINAYIPLGDDANTVITGTPAATLSGASLLVDDGQGIEEAQKGFDVEVGHKVPYVSDWIGETRAFIRYSHFNGKYVDNIRGLRFRAYTDVTDWFRIGGEVIHDNVRDTDYVGEIRFRIPFGGVSKLAAFDGLEKRMLEPIERDIDVVTQIADAGFEPAVAIDANGAPVSGTTDIWVVDNMASASGNGSFDNPFDTLAAAESAAGAGDIIYVRTGNGTSTNQNAGISLNKNGQKLIGAGVALEISANDYNLPARAKQQIGTITLAPAGTAPVIINTAESAGRAVSVNADNIEIAGININDSNIPRFGGAVIEGQNVNNVTIRNVEASIPDSKVIEFSYNTPGNYKISVLDNNFDGGDSADTLIQIGTASGFGSSSTVTATIKNNTLRDSLFHPLAIGSQEGNMVGLIENNISDGHRFGMLFFGGASGKGTFTIKDNNYSNTAIGTNTYINANNDSNITATYTDNTATGTGDGYTINANNNAIVNATYTGNTANGLSADGFYFNLRNNSQTTVTMSDNESTGNGSSGLQIDVINNAALTLTANNNTFTGNSDHGIEINSITSTIDNAPNINFGNTSTTTTAGYNSIFGNTNQEISLNLNPSLTNTLIFENNYFGVPGGLNNGTEFISTTGSTIDYTPFLTTDPN